MIEPARNEKKGNTVGRKMRLETFCPSNTQNRNNGRRRSN
jgi:hypothetical protein